MMGVRKKCLFFFWGWWSVWTLSLRGLWAFGWGMGVGVNCLVMCKPRQKMLEANMSGSRIVVYILFSFNDILLYSFAFSLQVIA